MNTKLIEFFNCALVANEENSVDAIELNKMANKVGYIIHPDCCTKEVRKFIESKDADYNSTFYDTWNTVRSLSREEQFIDQLIHYASTYGTNYQGEAYIPNNGKADIKYEMYTIITPITIDDLFIRCTNVLESGIALAKDTLDALCDCVISVIKSHTEVYDVNKIKNKEVFARICYETNQLPNDPVEVLRVLVYIATGQTMIIKNKAMYDAISQGNMVNMSNVANGRYIELAKIFNRYKMIFLALKHNCAQNAKVVNRIAKLSKKYHEPFKEGFWESVLYTDYTNSEIFKRVQKLDNCFKIIKLCQAIRERLLCHDNPNTQCLYVVRNGKVFNKKFKPNYFMLLQLSNTYGMLYERLVNILANKYQTKEGNVVVKLPKYLNLACPTSEKMFMSNIPYGSYYNMIDYNFVGIYWRSEWGTHDFDLSMLSERGQKIGWNSSFSTIGRDVIYSGDMTCADPEATEMLLCKNGCPNGSIYVNRFNGKEGSKYKLFFGRKVMDTLPRNYMVDPNCIELEVEMISNNREQCVGYMNDNKIYFMNLTTGNAQVSRNDLNGILKRKMQSYLPLKNVLLDAGFVLFDENMPNKEDVQITIDLTDLNKDSIINIFS